MTIENIMIQAERKMQFVECSEDDREKYKEFIVNQLICQERLTDSVLGRN